MSRTSSPIRNAMTVDVEDYFHVSVFDGLLPRREWPRLQSRVVPNTERLLDIFSKHGVSATFFVLGWVAERHPALIRRIAALGHELASHGYAHRLVYDQTRSAFADDVRRAKNIIEDAAGQPVRGYRAPSYSITPRSLWALDVLIQAGYEYDASIFPIRHDRYGIPISPRHPYPIRRAGGVILEAPASTVRYGPLNLPIGGGGYFRILPYRWTRWGIGRVNRVEQRAAIFYLHPWEVDPDQPRLPAGVLGRFRHYRNLELTAPRLQRLLSEFQFAPLAEVLEPFGLSAPIYPPAAAAVGLPYIW